MEFAPQTKNPSYGPEFNDRKYTAKVGQVGQFNGIEPPITFLSFVWLVYLGVLGFKLNRIFNKQNPETRVNTKF